MRDTNKNKTMEGARGALAPRALLRHMWRLRFVFTLAIFVSGFAWQFAHMPTIGAAQTVIFLTSGTTWTVPSDWNSLNNSVEVIGGGGSGRTFINAGGSGSWQKSAGGGGGGYSKTTNITLTPGASVAYVVGIGGGAKTITSDGSAGGDSYFNGTSCSGASVCAKGGGGGTNGTGGSGGAATSGVGSTKYSGGRGGNSSASVMNALGGGGAAGPNGNGNNGVDSSSSTATNGGSGDVGSGGTAGSGSTTGNGGNGGNGAEFDIGHGSGGGGGGCTYYVSVGDIYAGSGGNYGGGGGGINTFFVDGDSGIRSSGAGVQGLIVITYTPATTAGGSSFLMGMEF